MDSAVLGVGACVLGVTTLADLEQEVGFASMFGDKLLSQILTVKTQGFHPLDRMVLGSVLEQTLGVEVDQFAYRIVDAL